MKIREKHYTADYLLTNTVTFDKWQVLAENCFDTDCIDYINAVMNAKVIFDDILKAIEEREYNDTLFKLILYRSNIITQAKSNKVKIKIHKSA